MLQKQFNEAREAMKSLEQRQEDTLSRYNMLKAEYQLLAEETASQAKQREQEQAEAVNYEFVKNALISYLTSREQAVHINMLKVMFKAMKFTEEEQIRVKDAFNASNLSYVGQIMGSTLFWPTRIIFKTNI